jgi:hypothetical protein
MFTHSIFSFKQEATGFALEAGLLRMSDSSASGPIFPILSGLSRLGEAFPSASVG